MTTDAATLRKILHTLGRPTQAELEAGLLAVARMEKAGDDAERGSDLCLLRWQQTMAQRDAAWALLRKIEWYYSAHSGWTCVVCGARDAYKEHDSACLLGNFLKALEGK